MKLYYSECDKITLEELMYLFSAVGWDIKPVSYAKRVLDSINNHHTTFCCFDEKEHCMIGMISCMDDGLLCQIMYCCVHPDYRGMGVGKTLMSMVRQHYKVETIFVNTNQGSKGFYEKCDFSTYTKSSYMYYHRKN